MNNSDVPFAAQAMRVFAWLLLSTAGTARADAGAPAYATHGDPALAALIEESLERNPGLLRARLESDAERHQILQVTALPDPKLGITWHGRKPETRTGPQTSTLSVSQEFPWPGKLSDRGRIAAAMADVRTEAARAGEARVVRQVKFSYYDLGYLDRAIAVIDDEEHLLRHYESLAQARYAQGLGPQQAAVRLQAEITRVLNRRHDLVRQRLEVIATLNALRDSPAGTPVEVSSRLDLPEVRTDSAHLQGIGRIRRPEVRAARLLMEGDRDRVRLARRRYWPDIVLGRILGKGGGPARHCGTFGSAARQRQGCLQPHGRRQHPDLAGQVRRGGGRGQCAPRGRQGESPARGRRGGPRGARGGTAARHGR